MNKAIFNDGELNEFEKAKADLANAKELRTAAMGAIVCVESTVNKLERLHKWKAYAGFIIPRDGSGTSGTHPSDETSTESFSCNPEYGTIVAQAEYETMDVE